MPSKSRIYPIELVNYEKVGLFLSSGFLFHILKFSTPQWLTAYEMPSKSRIYSIELVNIVRSRLSTIFNHSCFQLTYLLMFSPCFQLTCSLKFFFAANLPHIRHNDPTCFQLTCSLMFFSPCNSLFTLYT